MRTEKELRKSRGRSGVPTLSVKLTAEEFQKLERVRADDSHEAHRVLSWREWLLYVAEKRRKP